MSKTETGKTDVSKSGTTETGTAVKKRKKSADSGAQPQASVSLPTLISTSVMLNAVVRGAEAAAEKLGEGHYSKVSKSYGDAIVSIFKVEPRSGANLLDTSQKIVAAENPVWSKELNVHALTNGDKHKQDSIFSRITPKFLFLNEQEALDYLNSIEELTVSSSSDRLLLRKKRARTNG